MACRPISYTATRGKEAKEGRLYRNRELQYKTQRDYGKGTDREDKTELQYKNVIQRQIL